MNGGHLSQLCSKKVCATLVTLLAFGAHSAAAQTRERLTTIAPLSLWVGEWAGTGWSNISGERTEFKREIAAAFKRGAFRIPMFVHDQQLPGTVVMAARRDAITYPMHDLPRGGEVRITIHDPDALAAIQEFIAFQQHDHHAGGAGAPAHRVP
jgi:hypothetical protein